MAENGQKRLCFKSIVIVAAAMALMAIGYMSISVCQEAEGLSGYAERQLVYCGIGMFMLLFCAKVPYDLLGRYAYILFGATLLLLIVVLALPRIRGSHRWINMGFFMLQPSELAKISQIILLSWYFRLGDHYRKLRGLVLPFVLTFIPMALILLEPDLGTSLLFIPTLYVMLFVAGARLRHLLGIVAIGTIIVFMPVPRSVEGMSKSELSVRSATCYWEQGEGENKTLFSAASLAMMDHHQLQRIDGWLNQGDPDNVLGDGYHLYRSKVILGSGKYLGRGDWDTAEVYLKTLPDDHTDFIFSVIGGQWGFLFCILLLVLYSIIVLLGLEIAATTYDPFGRLLSIGMITLLISQVFINIGMTMGLLPITGMTLPLVSYGGSSLVVNCIAIGLLVNIGSKRQIYLSRHPFEHKDDSMPVPYGPVEVHGQKGGNTG